MDGWMDGWMESLFANSEALKAVLSSVSSTVSAFRRSLCNVDIPLSPHAITHAPDEPAFVAFPGKCFHLCKDTEIKGFQDPIQM
jgi:hypothetical protein